MRTRPGAVVLATVGVAAIVVALVRALRVPPPAPAPGRALTEGAVGQPRRFVRANLPRPRLRRLPRT